MSVNIKTYCPLLHTLSLVAATLYDSRFAKSLTGDGNHAQVYDVNPEIPVSTELTARRNLLTGNMRTTLADLIAKLERGNTRATRTLYEQTLAMRAPISILNGGSWLLLQPRQDKGSRPQKWRTTALIAEGWKSFHRVSSMTYEIIAAKVAREVAIGCER